MATPRSLTCFVLAALLIELAAAASYTVGGPNGGWDTTTDVQTWASSQKFLIGDTLVFQYAPSHDVTEVTKADYDSCQATSPIKTSTGGSSTVSLTSPGKRYFICSTPGHCAGGMKLEVDTLAATSTPPAATPATPPAASPSSPPAASPSTPPPRSPAASPPSKSPAASPPAESPARSPSSALAPKAAVPSPAAMPGSAPPSETPAEAAPPSGSAAESPKSSANRVSLTFTLAMGVCFGVVSLLAV
ncbi:uclacyanin 1 isoform X1 [Rhodamnia argentea]|uniref:Uclacyanin 1 isoform X1 n=1 Tax=Rhodamnia argentea TaxID=178133 RepID=A0A8B8QH05_9MYRT|nr:uclacyanin 1 isoform X1 [Rhodamnia argentea]